MGCFLPPPQPPISPTAARNSRAIVQRQSRFVLRDAKVRAHRKTPTAAIRTKAGKSGRSPGSRGFPPKLGGAEPRTPVMRDVVSIVSVNGTTVPGVTITDGGVNAGEVNAGRSPAGTVLDVGVAIGGDTNVTL